MTLSIAKWICYLFSICWIASINNSTIQLLETSIIYQPQLQCLCFNWMIEFLNMRITNDFKNKEKPRWQKITNPGIQVLKYLWTTWIKSINAIKKNCQHSSFHCLTLFYSGMTYGILYLQKFRWDNEMKVFLKYVMLKLLHCHCLSQ